MVDLLCQVEVAENLLVGDCSLDSRHILCVTCELYFSRTGGVKQHRQAKQKKREDCKRSQLVYFCGVNARANRRECFWYRQGKSTTALYIS